MCKSEVINLRVKVRLYNNGTLFVVKLNTVTIHFCYHFNYLLNWFICNKLVLNCTHKIS